MIRRALPVCVFLSLTCTLGQSDAADTWPSITEGVAPQSVEQLWDQYDPRAEPLDIEVLQRWEQDGVVLRILRYRVGVFRGKPAMIAAIYGYPKGGTRLPGLVQVHGGGQYAHSNAVLTNARRGYATISLAWAGRIDAPDYRVTPSEVRLFWSGETEDPAYKLTTDWGVIDAYHAPNRFGVGAQSTKPSAHTIDSIESPRNCPFILWTMAARRALTFLEQQPEVDGKRLGIYGHSMGGKITVLTAGTDERVVAAAPSCGGISDISSNPLYRSTVADNVYLRRITCPTFFLSPSNDFHGHLADLKNAVDIIQTKDWRIACSPHHNHQDTPTYEVATQLWFDEHLQATFDSPQVPTGQLNLDTPDHTPLFSVSVDESREIVSVDVYYTQQANEGEIARNARITRFWHHSAATRDQSANNWTARLPIESINKPLWAYANVLYKLNEPISGAGYYYRDYKTNSFHLSSQLSTAAASQLQISGIRTELKPSSLIEDFAGDWAKQWFNYSPHRWEYRSHKIGNPLWRAPANAKLALEVQSTTDLTLNVGVDDANASVLVSGTSQWQPIVLSLGDFESGNGSDPFEWGKASVLSLRLTELKRNTQGTWTPKPPQFRNLRWISQDSVKPDR